MKISVIIPAYNRAAFLPRAVRSISKDIPAEIVIIDDCSTDNTKAVVASLQQEDPRIVFVPLSENKGVNAARNRGIEQAMCEWVQLLDSDDAYVPGGMEHIEQKLETIAPDIDVVGFMTLREVNGMMEPRGYRVGEAWEEECPTYEDILLKEHIRGDIHYCLRRSLFQEGASFFEDVPGFETEFFALLAKRGKKFLYVNQIVDERYSDPGYHLSDEPFKRWPRSFARAYRRFVNEHIAMLRQHPDFLLHYYLRIAKCALSIGDVRGLWWLLKALPIKVQLLIRR